jgi:hypothetical protein
VDPGSQNKLLNLAFAFLGSAALRTAAVLGIADHLAERARTTEELAELVGADASYLLRILRFLAAHDVFYEDGTGRFHLTPSAEPLCSKSPQSLRAAVTLITEKPLWLPAGRLCDSVRDGRTIFEEIFHKPFWEHVAADTQFGAVFNAGMASLSAGEDHALAETYDCSAVRTVVDVGGGRGGLLRELLMRNPGLTGVLHDQESVLSQHVLDVPALAGRWRTNPGDFFTSLPKGADLYVLKHVIHDWPDEGCVRILRACRDAMANDGRVLVVESVLPQLNAPHYGRTLDLMMMNVVTGRERSRDDYNALFHDADLRLSRILPTATFSSASIIEGVSADD